MKKHLYLIFILFVLIMSWESQKEATAVFAQNTVPKDSIRLRILANSDSPEDQQMKRTIRDRVIASVSKWSGQAKNVDEARRVIRNHLPELQQLVKNTLQEKGYSYPFHVQLGPTEFPTKMYGTQVFPAGTYEAVLITLGQAEGRNWWCVMFPPLCFVDISSGDTAQKKDDVKTVEQKQEEPTKVAKTNVAETKVVTALVDKTVQKNDQGTNETVKESKSKSQVEMRFFFVDFFKEVVNFFS